MQERSGATVEAILQATIQVLSVEGKERLTTTRVADRAGVSVGTLYQYFPNKSALLQACLKRHMSDIGAGVQQACKAQHGAPLLVMASALVEAYLAVKMRNVRESAALYAVSSDIEGLAISRAMSARGLEWVAEMFRTAPERLNKEPEVVAAVVVAALNGVSRRVLESRSPGKTAESLHPELITLVHAYLETCMKQIAIHPAMQD